VVEVISTTPAPTTAEKTLFERERKCKPRQSGRKVFRAAKGGGKEETT